MLASRKALAPWLVRLVAAEGHAVAVVQQPLARTPTLHARVTFASGRTGGARWRAAALVRQALRATPLEPDRLERFACVGLAMRDADSLDAESCADEGPLGGAGDGATRSVATSSRPRR